jgi:hypothetical protein
MKLLNKVFLFWVLNLPFAVLSADGWTTSSYNISIIDSVAAENYAYLTLENYVNSACSNNRIALNHPNKAKFDQMFSMVLSAFHSGKKVKFYFSDTSNCNANRILLIK